VDSAYVKANASMDSIIRNEIMDDSKNFMNELSDNEEVETQNSKAKHSKTGKVNKDWTSPSDPDARLSKKGSKQSELNYTAQVSVDTDSHVICGAMADFADKRDAQSLSKIVDQTSESLSKRGIPLQEVLADTNYSSGDALRYLEGKNIGAYIPSFGPYKPTREGFTYYPVGDYYMCSQGKMLPFKKISSRKDNFRKVYWSSKAECKNCPCKTTCIGVAGFKTLEDTTDKQYYDRMHERTTSIKGKQMKTLRSATIEPVLATLLCFVGMRKVYTKGIDLANKHVLMAATAYNIKKLLRFNSTNSIAAIAKFTATELINVYFQLYRLLLRLLKQFSSTKSRVSILLDYCCFESQVF
jgi:hypothetical protein